MLLINLGMMEGKENLHSIQCLSSNIFDSYNGEREYYVACNQNEYVESEGVFPKKLKQLKNQCCVLCKKYGLEDSHVMHRNPQNTRNILVHPNIMVYLLSGADEKNVMLQYNVKSGYCLRCKCCIG